MKVYNKEKTQILSEYDLTKGYLMQDTITINQPEIPAVEEQFHYETIKEYENGGKDVKKVVDVAGVEYQPAKTYEEEIYVYIPYTPNELAKQKAQQEYQELKEWFDVEYARKEQKYRRLHSLSKLTDDGKDPYQELINLYNEAEIKRARIQELERLLSDSSN